MTNDKKNVTISTVPHVWITFCLDYLIHSNCSPVPGPPALMWLRALANELSSMLWFCVADLGVVGDDSKGEALLELELDVTGVELEVEVLGLNVEAGIRSQLEELSWFVLCCWRKNEFRCQLNVRNCIIAIDYDSVKIFLLNKILKVLCFTRDGNAKYK